MSLRIIKAGLLDTVQDLGRYGFQHLGINPGGVMDRSAAQAVNLIIGKNPGEALIEIHFPASIFLFERAAMISLGGADFSATVNGEDVPLWQPVIVAKNSILQFQKWKQGARCYLGVRETLQIEKWLGSYSTNLKAMCGGLNGRALQKDDVICFSDKYEYASWLGDKEFLILPWKADIGWNETPIDKIAFVPGNEWDHLTDDSKKRFLNEPFVIGSLADRMGYRLQTDLQVMHNGELVSSIVSFGTIQILPNGELIILMADHQTAGGYPRIGHILLAHLGVLAQNRPGDKIYFRITDWQQAEELFFKQHRHLLQLQNACKFRLEEFFNASH
ncbi:MAG TPA: biotin-dependent carboxyltransferase family protein [Chitinophagaceae bacterium]|jgi:antagonist of KipI